MTWLVQCCNTLQWWLRRHVSTIVALSLHAFTAIAFAAMFFALQYLLPLATPVADFEASIQLLAQVLAVVVGVLLLGATVSLSSYDDAATLTAIQEDLSKATDSFFTKFFEGGRRAHKIDRLSFRRWMFSRPGIQALSFFDEKATKEDSWFIYRPSWDGVWYQVARSPFADANRSDKELFQVQVFHEVAICAFTVLRIVSKFRSSESVLVTSDSGTNGSRWFIESLESFVAQHGTSLPADSDLSAVERAVALAMSSEHYMREELREHSDNVEWSPYALTTFQIRFNEYATSLLHLELVRK